MTFTNGPFNYPLNIACFHTCAQVNINVGDAAKPLQAAALTGSYSSSINTSTGLITLPNTPCLLVGSITYYSPDSSNSLRYQWYDDTNSQYIGSIGQTRGLDAAQHAAGAVNEIACDEEAICIVQNINVKLIITASHGASVKQFDPTAGTGLNDDFAGKTKLMVYEF